jgi:hypothetical protein
MVRGGLGFVNRPEKLSFPKNLNFSKRLEDELSDVWLG